MARWCELASIALIGCGHAVHHAEDGGELAADSSAIPDGPDGKVGVFIAQGDVGRTILSCDGGNTWIANHSWDLDGDEMMCKQIEQVVCGTTAQCPFYVHGACTQLGCCNESPSQPRGVVYGNGVLASVWGHGAPGAIRTSRDGAAWTTTYADLPTSVVAFGDGTFVTAHNPGTIVSTDGATWTAGGALGIPNNEGPRAIGYGDGRFVVVAAAGGVGEMNVAVRDIVVSSDAGASWSRASGVPADCAIGVSGGDIVAGNGIFVIVDEQGDICRSGDGGQTWTTVATGVPLIAASVKSASNGVWTGSEFRFWGRDASGQRTMLTSPDGLAWTPTAMTTATALRAVAYGDGTFVASLGQYATQTFLRSTDGSAWQTLPATASFASHAISRITYARVDPGTVCP